MLGISIIITAFKSKQYIKECLDSVYKQSYFINNDNFEVLVGVDGDYDLLCYLKTLYVNYKRLRLFYSHVNKGPYILFNSLVDFANYDWLVRFDSDDIMYSNMIEEIVNAINSNPGVKFYKYRTDKFTKDGIISENQYAEGSICIDKKTFINYGGYKPWLCAADTELKERLKNVVNIYYINKPLFQYRKDNQNSITTIDKTKIGSDYRMTRNNYIKLYSKDRPKISFNTCQIYEYNPEYVVVCFTTWKKRLQSAQKTLSHFLLQTKKPDKIICVLSKEEFSSIPDELISFVKTGQIEILWVDKNTYCHKRWEVMRNFYNCTVLSIDDDIYYDTHYVEEMCNGCRKYPNCVICYSSQKLIYNGNERLLLPIDKNPSKSNNYLSGLSAWPPFVFPLESFNYTNLRDNIAKICDDSWLYAWMLKKNIEIYALYDKIADKKFQNNVENSQNCGIWKNINSIKLDNGMLQKTKFLMDCCKKLNVDVLSILS